MDLNSSASRIPQENISMNIVQAMATIKDSEEFNDFQVEVEGQIFYCHSFVLLSCSEFFRCMLRSNMREKQDRTVRLSNISAATFQLILDTLYTGNDLLTMENVVDVWHAVHLLQIAFLIEYCENFVVDKLSKDNLEKFKRHADFLHSRRTHEGILKYIMRNFSTLKDTEIFLRLDFEDVQQVIENDELVVDYEDVALHAVYAWVSYGDVLRVKQQASSAGDIMDAWQNSRYSDSTLMCAQDFSDENNHYSVSAMESFSSFYYDRKQYLAQLLNCTRYCLATEACIAKLYQHPLTLNDYAAKDILFKASSFKLTNYMRGAWSSASIHRNCMGFDHLALYCDTVKAALVHVSLRQNSFLSVPNSPPIRAIKLLVFNDKVFACTSTRGNIEIFVLEKNIWIRSCAFMVGTWDKCVFFLSHGEHIYVFSRKKMRRFFPNDMRIKFLQNIYAIASPQHALSYHGNILVFASVDNGNAVVEAAVHCCNTTTVKWTQLDNIAFTPKDMVSFDDDTDTYILDCGGNLWRLTDMDTIGFSFVGKLWNLNLSLTGALLFRKVLYVYIDCLTTVSDVALDIGQANGVFYDLKFYGTGNGTSNVIHIVRQSVAETPNGSTAT